VTINYVSKYMTKLAELGTKHYVYTNSTNNYCTKKFRNTHPLLFKKINSHLISEMIKKCNFVRYNSSTYTPKYLNKAWNFKV